MGEQMSLFDFLTETTEESHKSERDSQGIDMSRFMNPPVLEQSPCYFCIHAVRRGPFRLCKIGGKGYKKIGKWSYCGQQIMPAEV